MCAVEWKKTKDICINICSGGTPLTSNQEYYNGSIPWLRTQEVDWGYVYDTEIKITEDAIKNSSAKLIPADCVIIAMYGATAAKCCINKIPLSTNQACCNLEIDSDIALYKYVYYWFCKEYSNLKAMGEGSQNNISGSKIKGYLIPIPSLAKQQEIVSQLDTFTTLISNLESELDMRRKQYEHYRNQLLDFEGVEGVEWKTLGEIAINRDRMRKPITASKRVAGVYPYYGASGIVDYVDGYIFDGNYLLISEDGANLIARSTPIAFPISGKTWVNNHAHVLEFDSLITQRLVEIYLNSIDLTKYISGGAQPKLNQDNLNSILIPSPSINTQQQIVEKLDAFEQLIQSLETEIKLRKQQYEYYREKLLTFEKE